MEITDDCYFNLQIFCQSKVSNDKCNVNKGQSCSDIS